MASTGRYNPPARLASRPGQPYNLAQPALIPSAVTLSIVSAASLAYEVYLTRLFSLVFQYHFAFLAVSLAVLGLGAGALLAHRLGLAGGEPRGLAALPWLVLGFAITLQLSAIAFSFLPSSRSVIPYVLAGLVPFVLAGLFAATLYAIYSQRSAMFYAADLLGAAGGLLASVLLLSSLGAYSATLLMSGLAALSALLLSTSVRLRLVGIIVIALAGLTLYSNLSQSWLDRPAKISGAPPDKVMYRILADPAQQANVIDTAWSAFARVDLVQTNDPRQMFVFTDAGAGSYMLRFTGDLQQVGWLREQVEYLPFLGGPVERTLVLGAGAGKDVLQALLSGSSGITAVEINPAMIALTRRHAGYNGGILDHPGVQTVQADGRNFVERASSRFDLIYLNLVYAQATTPGSAALNESYIFTEEAFRAYWSRLAPSGRLAIVSHQALEGSRALISAIGALESEGLQPSEVLSRSALVMLPNPDPNQRISIYILRKSPWTEEEVAAFVEEALARGMQALYVPGVFEIAMRGLTNDEVSLAEFLAGSEYNLEPTNDDQPFFFHLDPGLPVALRSLATAVLVAALAYLAFALPGRRSLRPWQVAYFGLLGLGFMLVEVPLIQRAILLLGNPTLALVVVIASLLLSAGLGSLASGRWPEEILFNRVSQAALVIAALTVALLFLQPPLFTRILPAGLVWRALIAGLLLVPLGFTMGVPFASGLRLVGRDQPAAVALLWGWNAVASVLGSVLAALLAIQAGFSWALGLGAACYLVLAILTTMKKT